MLVLKTQPLPYNIRNKPKGLVLHNIMKADLVRDDGENGNEAGNGQCWYWIGCNLIMAVYLRKNRAELSWNNFFLFAKETILKSLIYLTTADACSLQRRSVAPLRIITSANLLNPAERKPRNKICVIRSVITFQSLRRRLYSACLFLSLLVHSKSKQLLLNRKWLLSN